MAVKKSPRTITLKQSPKCKQCKALTVEGVRCKNKLACHSACTKYCHVHSKGYKAGTNVVCARPSVARARKSPAKKSSKKASAKKTSTKKASPKK